MKIVKDEISLDELKKISNKCFGNIVKAVVDIDKKIMVIDADLHADQEALLIQKGSKQKNLWGINLYPYNIKVNLIEFDSMINLRPSQGNYTRSVNDPKIKEKIINIVNELIK